MSAHDLPAGAVDVLIAEEDAAARRGLRRLLEQAGYTCAEAESGREAVELAQRWAPRCVLLDLAMPGLDGAALARQLRADPRTQDVRIHCLAGGVDPLTRQEARQAGCELLLADPVDAPVLLQALGRRGRPQGRQRIGGLSKPETERLLDWLEVNGATEVACAAEGDARFTVYWIWPPHPE